MKNKTFKKLAVAAVMVFGISTAASADDWHHDRDWDHDHWDRGHHVVVYRDYYGRPIRYYQPGAVYYPYGTYVAPAPVYVAPAPVYAPPVASFNFRF